MSTTSKEEKEATWAEWGKHNKKPPKIKDYIDFVAIDKTPDIQAKLIKEGKIKKGGV